MTFQKTILLVTALSLTACNVTKQGRDDANPVDDLKVMFLGVDANTDAPSENLQRLIANIEKGADKFNFRGVTYEGVNTGFGAPFVRALKGNRANPGLQIDLDKVEKANGDARCARAKANKIQYHRTNTGLTIPDNFGKITSLGIKMINDTQWAGQIQLCTWIKNGDVYDEYFFKIDLKPGLEGTVTTLNNSGNTADPFPGTLDTINLLDDTATLAMMNQWDHKLHGEGKAVVITEAWRNGALLPRGHEVYVNDFNCFDFFVDEKGLAAMKKGILPDQKSYCMGRCDGLIMNTR